MFELTVERRFRAAHAVTLGGRPEAVHEHDWRVVVAVRGADLDDDGVLCDFHDVETRLDAALASLAQQNLNDTPAFRDRNPTAENVARHLHATLAPALPRGVALCRVAVTEAPGCTATYFAPRSP